MDPLVGIFSPVTGEPSAHLSVSGSRNVLAEEQLLLHWAPSCPRGIARGGVSIAGKRAVPRSSPSLLHELRAHGNSASPLELLLPGMMLHAVCVESG